MAESWAVAAHDTDLVSATLRKRSMAENSRSEKRAGIGYYLSVSNPPIPLPSMYQYINLTPTLTRIDRNDDSKRGPLMKVNHDGLGGSARRVRR